MQLVLDRMSFSRQNLLVVGRYALVLLAFCALLVKAFSAMQNIDSLPHIAPARPSETPVFVDRKHLSLVMAIHPNCVYAASSLGELRKIYARLPEEIAVTLLEFAPEGEAESWTTASATELAALSKLQARILMDRNGDIARGLGITKSGQLKIFSPNGKLLYDGGIAPEIRASGVGGSEELIVDIINGSTFNPVATSSFGCNLFDQPGCETTTLAIAHN